MKEKIKFPYDLDLNIGDGEELKLVFKELPLKLSFPQFHLLSQKITNSLGESFKNIKDEGLDSDISKYLPVLASGLSGLMNSLDIEYLLDFIKIHIKYIDVVGKEATIQLNEVFHFKGRPDLMYLIIIKIIEVYYKNFFIGLLKSLNLMDKVSKISQKFRKSTGMSGESTLKKVQTPK